MRLDMTAGHSGEKILILWQSEAEGKEGVEERMHPSKACVSLRDPLPATGLPPPNIATTFQTALSDH